MVASRMAHKEMSIVSFTFENIDYFLQINITILKFKPGAQIKKVSKVITKFSSSFKKINQPLSIGQIP